MLFEEHRIHSAGINGVYVDAEENYSLKEEVLFFRWVEESGRIASVGSVPAALGVAGPLCSKFEEKIFGVSLILVKRP